MARHSTTLCSNLTWMSLQCVGLPAVGVHCEASADCSSKHVSHRTRVTITCEFAWPKCLESAARQTAVSTAHLNYFMPDKAGAANKTLQNVKDPMPGQVSMCRQVHRRLGIVMHSRRKFRHTTVHTSSTNMHAPAGRQADSPSPPSQRPAVPALGLGGEHWLQPRGRPPPHVKRSSGFAEAAPSLPWHAQQGEQ